MRINARIDDQQVKQLEQIKKKQHLTTTQVIRRALSLYFQHQHNSEKSKITKLLDSDFIGCAESSEDLSENYKKYQAGTLSEKHGID
ncbi:MAG: CopG family transcriptional regulator [Gammaproteobacteria bacterium]|nr:CopG family transcriptional regulator [Gammaproteobacteria bacterium]